MKSIMEEASSISKAIEQAWTRAGKPIKFTIQVLETPERNMFGITVKSAKIAFFFDEQLKSAIKFIPTTPKTPFLSPKKEPVPVSAIQQKEINPGPTATQQGQKSRWNESMIQFVQEWIKQIIQVLGVPNITFSTSTSINGITLQFNNSITGNQAKDRLLFSSFAHLILATMRQKYKRPLKNLKIILITT